MAESDVPEVLSCPLCGLAQRVQPLASGERAVCARCSGVVAEATPESANRTLALAAGALLLYIPANLLPLMTFEYHGAEEKNTVWSGVKALADGGLWVVAAVVFLASMVIPLLKLAALFYLALDTRGSRGALWKTRLYRFVRAIGSWAMLDVFLLSVLVALVKLGQLASITPGPGAFAFTLVVVLTILATESFDPRLIWRHERRPDRPN